MIKRGIVCPHCGKEIEDVAEVTFSKRDIALSAGLGTGLGIFCAAAWHVTWWGAAGVFLFSFCVVVLMQVRHKSKYGKEV